MSRFDDAAAPETWRGAHSAVGGSGMPGPRTTGTPGVSTSGSTWTPTVANLVVLVVLEIVAYCALRWAFRTAHGG